MAIGAHSRPRPPRQHSIAPHTAAKPSALSTDARQWLATVVLAHASAAAAIAAVVALRHAAASQPTGDPDLRLTYCLAPTSPLAIAVVERNPCQQGFPVADKYQRGPKGDCASHARVPPNYVSAHLLSSYQQRFSKR